jgi:hypothetical protein
VGVPRPDEDKTREAVTKQNHPSGYFQNRFGEQWIFVYDPETKVGELRGGDIGWATVVPIRDGKVDVMLERPRVPGFLRAVSPRQGSVDWSRVIHEKLVCMPRPGPKPAEGVNAVLSALARRSG